MYWSVYNDSSLINPVMSNFFLNKPYKSVPVEITSSIFIYSPFYLFIYLFTLLISFFFFYFDVIVVERSPEEA